MNYDEAIKVGAIKSDFLVYFPHCKPEQKTRQSAAVDLKARESVEIYPRKVELIPLGVWWNFDNLKGVDDVYGGLHIRSSLAKKLIIPNGEGIIDTDYPGEFMLMVFNPSPTMIVKISKGDRVAQLILKKHITPQLGFLSKDFRTGGFGSTGK